MNDIALSREARNKELVRDRFEAWAQGTGSPFELLTDDANWTIEGGFRHPDATFFYYDHRNDRIAVVNALGALTAASLSR